MLKTILFKPKLPDVNYILRSFSTYKVHLISHQQWYCQEVLFTTKFILFFRVVITWKSEGIRNMPIASNKAENIFEHVCLAQLLFMITNK